MAKKRTDSLIGEERIEARLAFVRECVAKGLYNTEIISECRENDLFRTGKTRLAGTGKREMYLARAIIREHYLNEIRKRMRETRYTAVEEICKAYDQLVHIIRTAVSSNQLQAATAARKELNRLLGLRKPEQVVVTTDGDTIVEQMRAMINTVGVPKKRTNGVARRGAEKVTRKVSKKISKRKGTKK